MPKLYEYFGLTVLFYSNEHEPIHVHGKFENTESRAEFIIREGQIEEIRYSSVLGRSPLPPNQIRHFQVVIEHFAEEIVQRWIDYFVLHRAIQPQKITRRIR
ncbi:MAG: DUF4160 domain-containing protein [Chloroflexi bacterium]|nr:DUF4160 domain-containing protein [Ardenticatenaceae bacterium]MBL1127395.1 DUF4160 domain-containing protein [Chloroflexota bacterium]NOG33457.1 DUF4160 domain-containing protein [Chloroflexota bacterium]